MEKDKKRIDWLAILVAFGFTAPAAAIIAFVLYLIYVTSDRVIFLVLLILTGLAFPLALYLMMRHLIKRSNAPSSKSAAVHRDHVSDDDATEAFAAGMIGGALMHRKLQKRHSASDDAMNEFLWQEKIRRDMRDDGFIDW